jgi:hypothetical protein
VGLRRWRTVLLQITPLGDDTTFSNNAEPTVATMGQSPFASDVGTWIATWYNPANPGANAAPYTVAGTLLIVTVTGVLVEYV